MSRGTKFWVKKNFLPKIQPDVSVHFNGVPVHFGYYLLVRGVYRYTLVVYRYTLATAHFSVRCTGTL